MSGRVRSAGDGNRDDRADAPADESSNSSTRAFGSTPASAQPDQPSPTPSRGKYRLRILVAVLITLAVVVAAAVSVWAFPVFRVSEIAVEGARQVTRDQIIEASGVVEGENLLQVDQVDAASGVVSLPRIREATASRTMPNTVTIDVVERRVVAWLDEGGQPVLIDDTGAPFSDGAPPDTAVRVEGVTQDDAELLDGAVAVTAALSERVAGDIDYLRVGGPSEYVIVLNDGRTALWGSPTDNHNKAVALETVIQRPGQEWDISNPTMVTSR